MASLLEQSRNVLSYLPSLQIGNLKGKVKLLASEDIKEAANFVFKFVTYKKYVLQPFVSIYC